MRPSCEPCIMLQKSRYKFPQINLIFQIGIRASRTNQCNENDIFLQSSHHQWVNEGRFSELSYIWQRGSSYEGVSRIIPDFWFSIREVTSLWEIKKLNFKKWRKTCAVRKHYKYSEFLGLGDRQQIQLSIGRDSKKFSGLSCAVGHHLGREVAWHSFRKI